MNVHVLLSLSSLVQTNMARQRNEIQIALSNQECKKLICQIAYRVLMSTPYTSLKVEHV